MPQDCNVVGLCSGISITLNFPWGLVTNGLKRKAVAGWSSQWLCVGCEMTETHLVAVAFYLPFLLLLNPAWPGPENVSVPIAGKMPAAELLSKPW